MNCALKRTSKPTIAWTRALRIASRTVFASFQLSAIGFSMIRCLPARAAAIACSACSECGVQMSMTSMSGSASIAS